MSFKHLKWAVLILVWFLPVATYARALSEFNGERIRIHIYPTSVAKQKRVFRLIRSSESFAVYRRVKPNKKFTKVHEYTFLTDLGDLKDYLGYKPPPKSKSDKIKKKDEPDPIDKKKKELITMDNLLERHPILLQFSIFFLEPKILDTLGIGYIDNNVDRKKKYEYYFEFQIKGGRKVRYPQVGNIRPRYTRAIPKAPKIILIKPIEAGTRLQVQLPKAKAGVQAFAANIYRRDASGLVQKVNERVEAALNQKRVVEFFDEKLPLGKNYEYYATAVSFGGIESKPSKTKKFFTRSLKFPKPVQNVKVKVLKVGPEITWNPLLQKDIIGYNIFVKEGEPNDTKKKYKKLNKAIIPSTVYKYQHSLLMEPYAKYSYKINAVNKWGNEGPMSTSAFLTYRGLDIPPHPIQIQIQSGRGGNRISWKQKKRDTLRAFMVYRSKNREDTARPINRKSLNAKAKTYLDKEAIPGGKYWYTVRSVSKQGALSIYPAPIFVETVNFTLVAPPGRFRYVDVKGGVELFWSRPKEPNLGAFEIEKVVGRKRQLVAKVDGEKLRHKITGTDTTGTYRIYSVNFRGNRSKDFRELKIKRTPIKILSASNVRFFVRQKKVRFVWPAEPDGKTIKVELYRKKTGAKDFRKVAAGNISKLYLEDKPPTGTTYKYYVYKAKGRQEFYSKIFTVEMPR